MGDRLRFFPSPAVFDRTGGGVWEGTVSFEDGAFTVSTSDAEQIMNPEGWKLPHDWVDSRNWAATVGYGEFGTWNCPRRPLTCIHSGFGRSPQDYEKYLRPLYERYGFEKRILNVQIVKRAEEN